MFWNGIVGIFVLQLIEKFQWFLFLFMIPHEIIGVRIFAEWLATLCRPFRAERWVIGSSEVQARLSFCGLGRTRRWDPHELGHIELRENAGGPKRFFTFDGHAAEVDCALALVGHQGEDMFRIDALTEGEARWLGGEFCSLLKGCLKEPATVPQAVESLYDPWLDSGAHGINASR